MIMAEYRCFFCKRTISEDHVRRRVRCIYCGSKILFKPRTVETTIEAV
ncbi:MAG: DNA-directed RNA polymerase subunit P [Candidatus Woesearchaeota archaeon]|nr:MAG: DNA-directed RNA polymerase subunit P [Candidatus Woesearchaeota archaeon]